MELESLATVTSLMLIRYQFTQNLLIDLVTDVRHGNPHPAIITPTQMRGLLTTIQNQLPNHLVLPYQKHENDLLQIYRIGRMSTAVVNEKIIFQLKVPLLFRENYQMYKVIPLPTTYNGSYIYIQPSMNYLIVDYNREHYYTLNKVDLNNCLTDNLERYLCRIIHPIFNIHSENNLCEIDLLKYSKIVPKACAVKTIPSTNVWIQLSQPNKWLFVMNQSDTIDIICGEQISPLTLANTGIIEIKAGCYLRSREMVIQSHSTKTSRLNNYYLPSLNITDKLGDIIQPTKYKNNTKTILIKYYSDDRLKTLGADIKFQKDQENIGLLNGNNSHNIHHYTAIYLLFSLIIMIIIVGMIKYRFCFKLQVSEVIPTPTTQNVQKDTGNQNYQLTLEPEPAYHEVVSKPHKEIK